MTTISVIGAGAWGTALAQTYTLAGHDVILWARELALAENLNATRENKVYLPGFKIDNRMWVTNDLSEAMRSDIILSVIPAQYVRSILRQMCGHVRARQPLVQCAKGIEIETGRLLSDVMREECPQAECAILTGPTFAHDLVDGKPGAATLACADSVQADRLTEILSNKNLRLYKTTDIIGAQTGGAIKNVIAIACGIIEGLQLGESARAALVTRGLAEIARLTVALGGKRETLMGLCGVGDLMLTCSSMKSRNFSLGVELGKGKSLPEILESRRTVTEGVATARAAVALARDQNVDMPIVNMVYACLYDHLDPKTAVVKLMDRPVRSEIE
jgi:glycerol-3-phosphate dehydrogenase (NAD(P)+)